MKGFRDRSNPDVLTVAIDANDTTVSYQGIVAGWGPGTRIEIGQEILLVTEVDTSNQVATVVRGWLETTAESHVVNSPIFIGPRVYRSDVLDLFNDCLDDLFGRGLFQVGSYEVTYNPQYIGYEIPADANEIIRVDALKDTFTKYWEPVFDWFEMDNTDTDDFSTGRAIMMRVAMPMSTFRVIYTKPFTRLDSEADDLEADAGLQSYMTDLPYYFAMNRLMVDLERHRSQIESAQGHQRAQDTPPFLGLRTGEWYQARYLDRIQTAMNHQARENRRAIGTGYGS